MDEPATTGCYSSSAPGKQNPAGEAWPKAHPPEYRAETPSGDQGQDNWSGPTCCSLSKPTTSNGLFRYWAIKHLLRTEEMLANPRRRQHDYTQYSVQKL